MSGVSIPRFNMLKKSFEENFTEQGEIGANVYAEGRFVGCWEHNRDKSVLWSIDTIVYMMSFAKGITALCLWILIDRRLVDLNTCVAEYWQDFGQNGKNKIKKILGHQAAIYYFDKTSSSNSNFNWNDAIFAWKNKSQHIMTIHFVQQEAMDL